MRVRDHIAVSTTAAALLHPWLRRGAIGLWAGGVLIDLDHYAWYCVRERRLSPLAATRFYNTSDPPQHAATRALHNPAVALALLLLAVRRRALAALALGVSLHIVLDLAHEACMDAARARALERDAFACQACGSEAPGVGTHLLRQPWLFPSYQAQNLVSLCGTCHESAHASWS